MRIVINRTSKYQYRKERPTQSHETGESQYRLAFASRGLTLDDREHEFRLAEPFYAKDIDRAREDADHCCIRRLMSRLSATRSASVM